MWNMNSCQLRRWQEDWWLTRSSVLQIIVKCLQDVGCLSAQWTWPWWGVSGIGTFDKLQEETRSLCEHDRLCDPVEENKNNITASLFFIILHPTVPTVLHLQIKYWTVRRGGGNYNQCRVRASHLHTIIKIYTIYNTMYFLHNSHHVR